MPPDSVDTPSTQLLELLQSQLDIDRSADWFGYPRTRSLKELRDFLRWGGFPHTAEDRLRLSLIPYWQHDAEKLDYPWTTQLLPPGPLAPIFQIDTMVMNRGRGRDILTPEEFARYLVECREILAEFSAIRARMHNGED